MEVTGRGLDRALYSILMAAIDLKAFALFSLTFWRRHGHHYRSPVGESSP